ncbi:hypothetical protein SAMN02745687_01562 [Lachnospiraceae bacterium NK3A20]|nr:hypothetical protein SAMN02745687_01562 [Lachnospiraceae bacterium NK3A20]
MQINENEMYHLDQKMQEEDGTAERADEIFCPEHTDYTLSPYTGMTRQSWIEAGEYLLEGIFRHIPSMDAPLVMPRKETKVTYPHLSAPEEQQERERRAEIFEGLTRSFFIASVLVEENPELTIHGIRILEYYKRQILRVVTPKDPLYVGSYADMQANLEEQAKERQRSQEATQAPSPDAEHRSSLLADSPWADPFRTFQQTVETCALVIGLWASKDVIWDTYTQEEKDRIAAFLDGWARESTVPQNWRLFNMLDMAFLSMNGYPIDETIMTEHAQAILAYSVGDGWYRDGQSFDYYSAWAFSVYAPLWCAWYGYEHTPEIAARFEANSNALMRTYADMFDADGWTNMWGRSCIYRNAATSAFDGNLFLRKSEVNPGRARRIASGSLLQFLQHPDFRFNGIPTLGFYGQFTPLVQGYSCAESVLWLGKAFLCLHLGADHPFWTATEENGFFDQALSLAKTSGSASIVAAAGKRRIVGEGGNAVQETVLNGPALCFTNHRANGETILRTGKVNKTENDLHGMWNYGKLSYNTKYPWEATPTEDSGRVRADIEAQQYVLEDPREGYLRGNTTFWCGERDGVLFRRQFFHWNLETEDHWISAINLADFPLAHGIFRVDKTRLIYRPARLTLGSYGFPDNGTIVEARQSAYGDGRMAQAVILKGRDRRGQAKQMAMTIYDGWQDLEIVSSHGTNPDSEKSLIVCAKMAYERHYDASEPYVLISQVITKEDGTDFTDDELFPVASILHEDSYGTGAFGTVTITMKDGTAHRVNYDGMEANMEL